MRVPFAPSDGLCSECRQREAAVPSVETTEDRLAGSGAPSKYASLTRAAWERKYGDWEGHPMLRRLVGWPHIPSGGSRGGTTSVPSGGSRGIQASTAGSWLVLITSPGYGHRKTGLGTAVLGEALDHGLGGMWLSQVQWLRDLKASWTGRRDVDPEHVVWNRAVRAEVLMFDELGGVEALKQREKAWWRVQVTQLLHERECRQLPTIVTANLSDWREVRRIHESLVSRMDVPLKVALPSGRDYRALERKQEGCLGER